MARPMKEEVARGHGAGADAGDWITQGLWGEEPSPGPSDGDN